MNYSALEKCSLFRGIPAKELRADLGEVSQHIQCYDKDEMVFHLMEKADRVGIILAGCVEAVKPFPSGREINVSIRKPGEMIGHAAAFSATPLYPCDIVALEPAVILMMHREDVLLLMQKDIRILENFVNGIATATYFLQEKLELLSYSGIAQKAAYYLLLQSKRTGSPDIRIPKSVSNWAALMNVSRPSLHRELTKMEKDGIISYQPPHIHILDENALQEVLGG